MLKAGSCGCRGPLALRLSREQIVLVGGQVRRCTPPGPLHLGRRDRAKAQDAAEPACHPFRHLALHGKDVLGRAVPAVRPDMRASSRIDQLRSDADLVALALQRAFQHIANVQLASDLPHIDRLAFVDEGRVAGDHVEVAEPG